MADEPDPYEELGVARGAEQEVVEAAYHALIRKYHPDHATDGDEAVANERAQRLNAAWALIGTEEKRRAWDARVAAPPPPPRPPDGPEPRRRRGPRVSVARYFGRRREEGEARRIGWGAAAVVAATLALLAFWLADVRRYWGAAEPPRVERN
jgi:curved DNA-binding protein CbpA